MRISPGASSEAPASWLSSVMVFWPTCGSCFSRQKSYGNEKQSPLVVENQPTLQPRPVAAREIGSVDSSWKDKWTRKSFGSGRRSFSVTSRAWSDASSRRPVISAPSNFQHLSSASFQFPPDMIQPLPPQQPHRAAEQMLPPREIAQDEQGGLRPLELSLGGPRRLVSPLLPHFEFPRITTPPPPPAYSAERSEEVHQLFHQRSYSYMSFHVPRRQPVEDTTSTTEEDTPPRIPAKSKNRARAYTSPDVDAIKKRVASAMMEVEKLQRQIDDVIERQSIYANSRPSTPYSVAHTLPDPMPSIPALPPMAPSFAERLNADTDRPQTAPAMKPAALSVKQRKCSDASSMSSEIATPPPPVRPEMLPPPPLPLVLRPPLRKKKSFSRVSTWLFPNQDQDSGTGFESITNKPGPVKGSQGFYQIVAVRPSAGQHSCDSLETLSTWNSDEEQRSAPSSWSPDSTPLPKQDDRPAPRRYVPVEKRGEGMETNQLEAGRSDNKVI